MLSIYLARHGQNEDNANGILNGHRDLPLTDIGLAQAREIASKIASSSLHFDAIYSSPLIRAHRTAEIIAQESRQPAPVVMQELIERNFGVMTGIEQSRVIELCAPNVFETDTITYFLSPEGAETFPQLIERAKHLLAKLNNLHKDGSILLVAHGDIGKMIYAAYYGLNWQSTLKQFHFGNSELLLLSPASSASQAHVHFIEQFNN